MYILVNWTSKTNDMILPTQDMKVNIGVDCGSMC